MALRGGGGGKGGRDQQRLAGDARGFRGVELVFEAFVHDALVCGVHVHHHQALLVFGQDVDAMQLGDGTSQRPGVVSRVRVG